MKVLHICNDYAGSKVHSNLVRALDNMGIAQTVYCPVREKRLLGGNQFEGKNVEFVFSFCIKRWYKYVYHLKCFILFRDMRRKINLNEFDIIRASTFFSDGGLALTAYKKYGIPYMVAVRNTDINVYIKKLEHTYRTGPRIALYARKIIFISKGEMDEFCQSQFVKPIFNEIRDKIIFLPNGIDSYWLKHITHEPRSGRDILYIGDFSFNKNIVRLANAVISLRMDKAFDDVRLLIVGGEKVGVIGKNDNRIYDLMTNHPNAILALGRIYDKDKLLEVMRTCALFAMPSIHETFGLVYIEALSQNLPVIYTKGQGIDGLFDNRIGVGVNALSEIEIQNAIRNILMNQNSYSNMAVDFSVFDWDNIAKKYLKLYKEIFLTN